jgi:glutamine synthetase
MGGIDPGDPNEDNLYMVSEAARRRRSIDFLPQTLQEAVAAFCRRSPDGGNAWKGAVR